MNIFWDLLPMILGTALAPAWIIIVLLILRSDNGLVKATAFVAGTTIVRLLQGLIFGHIFRSSEVGEAGSGPSVIVSVLLAVLGILLLISAVKKLLKEDDLDAPPPKWMSRFDRATALSLLGLGALSTLIAPKLWVFTLSAIGVISSADFNPSEEFQTFLLYTLIAQALIILPLVIYAVTPRQSASLLQSASDWLMRYNSQITIIVSFIFGSFFLWKGISGLFL
ncbi:GAP family protein [Leptolyngbya sp. 7M]|uniref:GAP family protein n=1 Tax=Leptolyngbya sp. 7M TaxID=2812896 RepID=UPI001B8C618C|nr:GAP family protein [Leptolyngbya sp. 7M]QYO68180.1 GAP family protein [Leptolyngbya sp. 7M]